MTRAGRVPKNVTLVRPVQPQNAQRSILVTLLGIVMLVRPVHSKNIPYSILVTPFEIVTLVRPLQKANA